MSNPFFCQVEAVETAIWLTEVAPQSKHGKRILDHLAAANKDTNPELMRLALKLATGAGKTTVMAMVIAWQTIDATRRPAARNFTCGFLLCVSGATIKGSDHFPGVGKMVFAARFHREQRSASNYASCWQRVWEDRRF